MNDGVWTRSLLQNDYRHSMDLSAFLSPTSLPPLPPPAPHAPGLAPSGLALHPGDPPPYTEQLLAGHTTLMHGTKPWFPKEIGDGQDQDSTLLTAGDVSVFDSSVHHPESLSSSPHVHVHAQQPPMATDPGYIYRQAGAVAMTEPRDSDVWSSNGLVVRSSTPIISLRALTPRDTNPFNTSPNMSLQSPTQPNFQRPLRSMSLDYSNVRTDGSSRAQPHAVTPVCLFPQRPVSQQETDNPTPFQTESVSNNAFPTRPARLPPLQNTSAIESSSQHRKRKKRKRGHSWHGEPVILSTGQRLALSPTTTCAIDSVAE